MNLASNEEAPKADQASDRLMISTARHIRDLPPTDPKAWPLTTLVFLAPVRLGPISPIYGNPAHYAANCENGGGHRTNRHNISDYALRHASDHLASLLMLVGWRRHHLSIYLEYFLMQDLLRALVIGIYPQYDFRGARHARGDLPIPGSKITSHQHRLLWRGLLLPCQVLATHYLHPNDASGRHILLINGHTVILSELGVLRASANVSNHNLELSSMGCLEASDRAVGEHASVERLLILAQPCHVNILSRPRLRADRA